MTQRELAEFNTEDETSAPSTDDAVSSPQFIPDTCIGFDITADYAHFRKVGNNSAKPSYRIPPRTTLAGLLAGIMGLARNSYYDLFAPDSSAVAVVAKEIPHTYTMGITTVNTKADDAIQYLPKDRHWRSGAEMLTPDSYITYDRQRDTYEMLVDPVYRVYVALAHRDAHEELRTRLQESRYHYSPSLGLSECLAELRNVETHTVTGASVEAVDSVAYDGSVVVPRPGITVRRERAPLYMEAEGNGRRTTAFGNITYTTNRDTLPISGTRPYSVGAHDVVFA